MQLNRPITLLMLSLNLIIIVSIPVGIPVGIPVLREYTCWCWYCPGVWHYESALLHSSLKHSVHHNSNVRARKSFWNTWKRRFEKRQESRRRPGEKKTQDSVVWSSTVSSLCIGVTRVGNTRGDN